MQVAQRTEVRRVRIEGVHERIAIRHGGPVHLHKPRARFNQAAREQQALAERMAAIFVAQRILFLGEIEGIAGAAGRDEVESFLIIAVDARISRRPFPSPAWRR